GWLLRECTFPVGVFLMTGTCIVPPDDFMLRPGDVVHITIPPIGTLTNLIAP
ncbi:MAG: 2-hydroxyhepta-2,4-diene-1,7-dioate isomerase, partial [Verrucomicrobiia bacterium]